MFSFSWGMNEKTDVHSVWREPAILKCARRFFSIRECARRFFHARHTKMCTSVFFIHTSAKQKISTVNSNNVISNHFHAKPKGKQLRNEAKFKFTRKRKNKLTNGHGGMIIQLRATIVERIRNVQIQAFQTGFIYLLSLPFLCALRKRLRIRSVISVNYHYITVLCPFNLSICFKCYNTV